MKLPAKVYLKAFVNILLSCTAVLLCIYVLPKIALFFMPFLIGWLVACLAAPMVRFCEEKLKIKRNLQNYWYRCVEKIRFIQLSFLQIEDMLPVFICKFIYATMILKRQKWR